MMHSFFCKVIATAAIATVASLPLPAEAKALFLSHFNDSLNPAVASGKQQPAMQGSSENTGIGAGYPYEDSMPAVGGLKLKPGGFVAYPTAGNIRPDEGTIMFRFKLSHAYMQGPKTEYLFTMGGGRNTADSWKNIIVISWGGWNNQLNCALTDADGKTTKTTFDTSYWQPDTNWHHVAFSWSKANRRVRLFINGRMVDSKEGVTAFPTEFPPNMFLGTLNGWHEWAPHQYDELMILDRECGELEAAAACERKTEFPLTYNFQPEAMIRELPLGDAAITPFADDRAADRAGGWTDQGPDTDRHDLKPGRTIQLGIPFVIGDRCIVLANSERDYYPKERTIKIGGRWESLLFLQCGAWIMAPGNICGYYSVGYGDGSTAEIPLVARENIGDWAEPVDIDQARAVLPGTGGFRKQSCAFLYHWNNPHPEKSIETITFRTAMDEAMPILIAVSGVKPGSGLAGALDLLTRKQKNEIGRFTELGKTYLAGLQKLPEFRKTLEGIQPTAIRQKSFYGREALRLSEEAELYLREIERNRTELESAVARQKYDRGIDLEKNVGYLGYLPPLFERIRKHLDKEKNAQLLNPLDTAKLPEITTTAPVAERLEIVLNGPWEQCGGTPERCDGNWSAAIVPGVFNDKQQQKWLRRKVAIPAGVPGQRWRLHFECAAYLAEVYVNRRFAGRHIGLEPFSADITEAAVPGRENEILVFLAGKTPLFNGKESGFSYPCSHTWSYGLFQDVLLQRVPPVAVEQPYAWLDAENILHVRGRISGTEHPEQYTLEVAMERPDRQEKFGPFPLKPGRDGDFEVKAAWEKPLLWGIGGEYGAPNLFRVSCILRRGNEIADRHTFRTGFARFTVEDKLYFALNGKRIFLQGDHYWTSEGHEGATSRAFMMRYFRLLREANFNITRDHHLGQGNTDQSALETADELGFLLQPEAISGGAPTLVRSRNYSDPVFRRNLEVYRRGIARKLRTHPAVVIFSGSNEIFQTIDPLIDQTAGVFADLETVFHEEAPHILLTEQGSNWRKEFPTVDVHYSMGKAFNDWNRLGDRPAIHGEYNFMQGYYFDMQHPDPATANRAMNATAKAYRERIAYEKKNGLAGTMPFPAFYMMGFCTASPALKGPFADKLTATKTGDRWYLPYMADGWVAPAWPSMSGRGRRVDKLRIGSQAENLNFWDSTRVEFTPNAVSFAFRDAFDPMPPLPKTAAPEVIVTVPPGSKEHPVWVEGPALKFPEGILPDAEGRAWFQLPSPGPYKFTGPDGRTATVNVGEMPLRQKPGFHEIQRLDLRPSPTPEAQ